MSLINVDSKDVVPVSELQMSGPLLTVLVVVINVYELRTSAEAKKRIGVITDYTAHETSIMGTRCAGRVKTQGHAIGEILLIPKVRLQTFQGEESAAVNVTELTKIGVNILSHNQFLEWVLDYKWGPQENANLPTRKTESIEQPGHQWALQQTEDSEPGSPEIRPVQRLESGWP
jgi:hypothetical protein